MRWQPSANLHQQLRRTFENGAKALEEWRLGMEREHLVLQRHNHQPLGFAGPVSVSQFFQELQPCGWQPEYEDGAILSLKRGDARVTLEPACQIEFSGAPQRTVAGIAHEYNAWLHEIKQLPIANELTWLALGVNPLYEPETLQWIPKQRYHLMRRIFPERGTLGTEMMSMTAATQVSVDYADEADCADKFRTACALVPLLTALFANSPITRERKSGFISYRSHIWAHTDPARCGIPPFVFRRHDSFFDAYIDYALDVPMFFVLKHEPGGDRLVDARSTTPQEQRPTYRQFLSTQGETLDEAQWLLHLSTLFPEVRLKNYIELRTPDCTTPLHAFSFPALVRALLYHPAARQECWRMLAELAEKSGVEAQRGAAALGLSTARFGRFKMLDLAQELASIAQAALQELDRDKKTNDTIYLAPLLEQVFDRRVSPGEELLRLWDGPWRQDPQELIEFLSSTSPLNTRLTLETTAS